MELTELIVRAPWREAVTYHDTGPHEYVVIKKDKQEEPLAAVCKRFCVGEGVDGRFFRMKNKYLFIGDYKYWLMTTCTEIDLDKDDYVLNRALIYRDRRDFLIRDGDNGRRDKHIDGTFGITPSEYYMMGDGYMSTEELGKLENVPVREVWGHEAHDFTPWLAENLPLLGEALDMELEVVQTEAQVGDFSLDILAKDANGVTVAIENQLASTDHGHLGQLLTYAAGKDACILIWIAPEFRHEHREAIDWFNRCTRKEIEAYGVEVRAVRIGDSLPAPLFVPVAFAADAWDERKRRKLEWLLPGSLKARNFFQPLIGKLQKKGLTDRLEAYARRDHPFPSGLPDIEYHASLEHGRKVWVYIPGWPKDSQQPIFDKLRADREDIEEELQLDRDPNTHMEWNVPNTGTIGVYRDGSIDDPEEELEEIRQ